MSYNYFGKKILILGIGLTGMSCINFFLKRGIIPRIIDESKNPIHLKKIPKNIQYYLGNLEHKWILESDIIIISPGISSFRPILIKARSIGIEIISDIELFARETIKPIISITGTNGKSTVSTMIEKIAKNTGYNALLGGNIGVPILEMLDRNADLYILELSSFQLENIFTLKSKISVILNISEDHIDRYPKGFTQYQNIKLSIYKRSEICLINLNYKFNIFLENSKKWISFGTKKSDYYTSYEDDHPILCYQNEKILNTSKTKLIGHHNYDNALVALAISDAMQFPRKCAIDVLSKFSSLPHRFQIIHHHKRVRWINDSKSTNVHNTKIALECLNIQGTIWLLIGGKSKSANFNVLKSYFKQLKIRIYCFGEDGIYLSKIYKEKSIYVTTLKKAMILISKQVKSGDVVLLSPGCSSLDQFSNFQERGNYFIKLAKELN